MLSAAQGLGTEEANRNTAAAFIEARYRHTAPMSVRTYCTQEGYLYRYTDIATVLHLCVVHVENIVHVCY